MCTIGTVGTGGMRLMPSGLSDVFMHGHTPLPGSLSRDGEIVFGIPTRQMELIHLQTAQLAAQRAIERDVSINPMIRDELRRQSDTLERLSSEIDASVAASADRLAEHVESLGSRLSACLDEVAWILRQQTDTLDEILVTLRESRANDARQLLQQALRLLANREYVEAEGRLLTALESDKTDCQVLMNLGYIEMHKRALPAAFDLFHRALTRPEQVPPDLKRQILLTVARLHYLREHYSDAFRVANGVFQSNISDAESAFISSVYAALAGQDDVAMSRLREAILLEPSLFARATVEPDFAIVRRRVLRLLEELSVEALKEARRQALVVGNSLGPTDQANEYRELLEDIGERFMAWRPSGESIPYSRAIEARRNLAVLASALEDVSKLRDLLGRREAIRQALSETEQEASTINIKESWSGSDINVLFGVLAVPVFYFIAGVVVASGEFPQAMADMRENYVFNIFFWPLLMFGSGLGVVFGKNTGDLFSRGFWGIVFGALVAGATYFAGVSLRRVRDEERTQRRKLSGEVSEKATSLQKELQQVERRIDELYSKIEERVQSVPLVVEGT